MISTGVMLLETSGELMYSVNNESILMYHISRIYNGTISMSGYLFFF
jgi:hypothetical protein